MTTTWKYLTSLAELAEVKLVTDTSIPVLFLTILQEAKLLLTHAATHEYIVVVH